jgi:serine/threonine-protein kinase
VKVLDFGLAKAMDPVSTSVDMSLSPTVSSPLATRMGVLLGTAPYMSPEQAKGKPVDKRTDIWAFGCVVYEMLTGKRAFDGEDVTDVSAAIVRGEPNWTLLPIATPPGIRKVLRRCLEKDRKRRFGDIGDVRFEIDEALHAPAQQGEVVPPLREVRKSRSYMLAVGAAAIAAAVTAAAMRLLAPQVELPVRRSAVLLQNDEQFISALAGRQLLDISPDGTRLVYVVNQRLMLRALDRLDSVQIPGTERAVNPFFSNNGEWIGFWQEGQLKKIAISGGPAVPLCRCGEAYGEAYGGAWGANGTIVFSRGKEGVWSVPDGGGQPTQLIKLDTNKGEVVEGLQVLPGNRGLILTVTRAAGPQSAQAKAETAQVVAVAANSSERKVLVTGAFGARYLPSGHLVYARQGTILAQPFDVDRLVTTGNPIPVIEGVTAGGPQGGVNAAGISATAQYSVSRAGVLAYMPTRTTGTARTLVWVDRDGKESPISAPPHAYAYPRISPDGTQIAVDARDEEGDIQIWDLARQTLRRLTFDPKLDGAPVWTPDGQRLVYTAIGQGLVSRAADGTGPVESLTRQGDFLHGASAFTADGKILLFTEGQTGNDIMQLNLAGRHEVSPLIQTNMNERNAALSPDGKWIAYEFNESGPMKIVVRPFPDVQAGRWEVPSDDATRPAWVSNREISYLMPGGTMMVVGVNIAKGIQFDNPRKLFSGPYFMTLTGRTYDISRDGKRFLMVKTMNQTVADAPRIILVENWFEELKRKVPVK